VKDVLTELREARVSRKWEDDWFVELPVAAREAAVSEIMRLRAEVHALRFPPSHIEAYRIETSE